MKLAALLALATVEAQRGRQSIELTYEMVTQNGGPNGTPNCFDPSQIDGDNFNVIKSPTRDDATPFTEEIELSIAPGFLCYFETRTPTIVSGNDKLALRYFEFSGYGPDIMLRGDDACQFIKRKSF